jgi:pyruvate dehydrogenase complex dehydrogenase (E1) component
MGEGLQHQDGHSHVMASTVPVCHAYDPAFAYELATIIEHGIKRMYGPNPEDIFYYLTVYNENYVMPAKPQVPGIDEGIMRGLYKWAAAPEGPVQAGHHDLLRQRPGRRAGRSRGTGGAVGRGRGTVVGHVVQGTA